MIFIAPILAVLIGSMLVFVFKPKQHIVQYLLSFSGAYLLGITVTHLMPEVYITEHNHKTGLFILLGILLQSILEYFSKGVEHGHIHLNEKFRNVPWVLLISLSIHAFSEGVPIGYASNSSLLWAIVVHKVPIGIVLTSFLLNTSLKRIHIYALLFLFSLMSPLGTLFSITFTTLKHVHTEINALVIGIFLHISTIILFESSKNHTFNIKKFIAILAGMSLALI